MFIYDGRIFIVNDTGSSKEVSRVRDVGNCRQVDKKISHI
mgnify:CR=1 FL=1